MTCALAAHGPRARRAALHARRSAGWALLVAALAIVALGDRRPVVAAGRRARAAARRRWRWPPTAIAASGHAIAGPRLVARARLARAPALRPVGRGHHRLERRALVLPAPRGPGHPDGHHGGRRAALRRAGRRARRGAARRRGARCPGWPGRSSIARRPMRQAAARAASSAAGGSPASSAHSRVRCGWSAVAGLGGDAGEVGARPGLGEGEEAAQAQHALQRLGAVADRVVEAAAQVAIGERRPRGSPPLTGRPRASSALARVDERRRARAPPSRRRATAAASSARRPRAARRPGARPARAAGAPQTSSSATVRSRSSRAAHAERGARGAGAEAHAQRGAAGRDVDEDLARGRAGHDDALAVDPHDVGAAVGQHALDVAAGAGDVGSTRSRRARRAAPGRRLAVRGAHGHIMAQPRRAQAVAATRRLRLPAPRRALGAAGSTSACRNSPV